MEDIVFGDITLNSVYNNHIILQNFYNNSNIHKYVWINNPNTGMFNPLSNIIDLQIHGRSALKIVDTTVITSNLIGNFTGSGCNISNINWCNIINIPSGLINSNTFKDILEYYISSNILSIQNYYNNDSISNNVEFLVNSNILYKQYYINSNSFINLISFYISSNTLYDQKYINSNSIQDLTSFNISSNILNKQNYINSNSIEDITKFYISSNNLYDQRYINSNSIADITSFLISSNILNKQNYINSNSITDIISFYISSNNLLDQKYINSNSISDIVLFYISSNNLHDQNYINSNTIEDLVKFYISSNILKAQNFVNSNSIEDIMMFYMNSNLLNIQNYINSNSITDIINFYISCNLINNQNYINSNSISDIISFIISSNNLIDQNYINSNSIIDIVSFLVSSNTLNNQQYINSNKIDDIFKFYISSNNLIDQNYINSNSIQDITSFYISSNNLYDQQYINSNITTEILNYYISSNILSKQRYINSNSIIDNLEFYISSNILNKQNYINSNSIQDLLSFIISSNLLNKQNYINSNSIQDLLEFIISSNLLNKQNYINSNSIADITSFLISSNNLYDQQYINSNSITDIISFIISSNILNKQNYINSNSIEDITSFYISSNNLYDQQYINSNSIEDIISFLISSNILNKQNYINSNSITDITLFYISSNNLYDQQYINSNSIADIISFLISSNILNKQNYINSNSIEDITSFLISSNILNKQNYINSNSIQDILEFYISSNILNKQNYINSNSIEDITSFIISSNILNKQNYINSNSIEDIISFYITSNNLIDQKYINSNSIEDIISFLISSNNLIDQKYINSNSIEDIVSFLITSNNLYDQQYYNSNSIEDIVSFLITSNNLYDQNYINSNSIVDITSFYITSNNLYDQQYINSNSIEDVSLFYISSNIINNLIFNNDLNSNYAIKAILHPYFNYETQNTDIIVEGTSNRFIINNIYNSNITINGSLITSNLYVIGSNTILNTETYQLNELQIVNNSTMTSFIVNQLTSNVDIAYFYNIDNIALSITSNSFIGIGTINPSVSLEVIGDIKASNITGSGSNITDIKWSNLTNIPTYFISSNILASQKLINSNSIADIVNFYIDSNILSPNVFNNGFIHSNNIAELTSNLGFDIIQQREIALKALTFNDPLLRINDTMSLKLDKTKLIVNNRNQLTLAPEIEMVDNLQTFKFNLRQGNMNYPTLWYYQLKISDFSKKFIIDGYEYNIFNLTSWTSTNMDMVYNSLIITTNKGKGSKKVKSNIISQGNRINLGNNKSTTEGWQLDNDINYMTWYSTGNKIIYNILSDQIITNSNILDIENFKYITSNDLLGQQFISSNTFNNYISNFVNSNVLNYFLPSYLNNTQTTDNIIVGTSNLFITNNNYNSNLLINGSLNCSNINLLDAIATISFDRQNTEQLQLNNNDNITALIINQIEPDTNVVTFNNYNSLVLIINSNNNVGINTNNPLYPLDVNGTIKGTEIIGSGTNLKNINFENIVNTPKFITSNIYEDFINFYITSNDINNILTYDYINSNNLAEFNSNFGFDTIQQRQLAIMGLSNSIVDLNNNILSNLIINNNILTNNYGIVIDNYYTDNTNSINIDSNNYLLFNNTNTYYLNSNLTFNLSYYNAITILNLNDIHIPMVWYKFEGTEFLNDSSGNNYNLTAYNNTSNSTFTNMIGNSAYFNKSLSQYFKMPLIDLYKIQTTTGITFSMWVYITSLSDWTATIFNYSSYYSAGYYNPYFDILLNIGIKEFHNNNTSQTAISFSIADPITNKSGGYTIELGENCKNTWHHIAWAIDKNNKWKIWLDNIIISNTIICQLPILQLDSSPGIYIGRMSRKSTSGGPSIGSYYLDGYIEDFRIYDTSLTTIQVNDLYNINYNNYKTTNKLLLTDNSYPTITVLPKVWYKLDTNVFLDSSSNNNTLTPGSIYNVPTLVDKELRNGNSAYFSSSRYLYSTIAGISGNSFSFSMWAYPTTTANMYALSFGNVYSVRQTIYFGIYNNQYNFNFYDYTYNFSYPSSNDIGRWVHLACTYDISNNMRLLYRNGILVDSYLSTVLPNPNTNFYIGQCNGNYWNGYLNDLRIYTNTVLNQTQIYKLYTGDLYIYHYANKGPLYVNYITGKVGINTGNPSSLLEVNGTLKATNIFGSGSNLTNINYNNLINLPTLLTTAYNNITSNVLSYQYVINSNYLNTFISIGQINSQPFIKSANVNNILTRVNNNIYNFGYINNINNINVDYTVNNDSILSHATNNNYGTILNEKYIGDYIFDEPNKNSYIYFNSDINNVFQLNQANSSNYIINYRNGLNLLYYTSNINVLNKIYTLYDYNNGVIKTSGKNINIHITDNTNTIIMPTIWYKFDNDGLLLNSINSNLLTVMADNATFGNISYKGNNSILFDYSLSITGNDLNLANCDYSISYWIYWTNTGGNQSIIFTLGDTIYSFLIFREMLYFSDYSQYIQWIASYPFSIFGNKWTNIIYTYSKNNNSLNVYINSVYIFTVYPSKGVSTYITTNYTFGSLRNNTGWQAFIGYMNDFRVYKNVVLSQSQINQLFDPIYLDTKLLITSNYSYSYTNYNALNPKIWHKFDNDNILINYGTDINNTLTDINSNINSNNNNYIKGNNSLLLNGLNQYVAGSNLKLINNSNFSISTWIYPLYNSNMNIFSICGNHSPAYIKIINRFYREVRDSNNNIVNPYIWYKFDGSNWLNDYMNNFNLTNCGATLSTNSFIGNCMLNGYVQTTNTFNPFGIIYSTGMTIHFWVHPNNYIYPNDLIRFTNKNSGLYFDIIFNYTHTMNLRNNVKQEGFDFGASGLNKWNHVVWCLNTNSLWTVYFNNVLVFSSTFNLNNDTYNTQCYFSIASGNTYIDDVRIYNRILTPKEISDTYYYSSNFITSNYDLYNYNNITDVNNINLFNSNVTITSNIIFNYNQINVGIINSNYYFDFGDNGLIDNNYSVINDLNKWTHLVFSYNTLTNTRYIYINGNLLNSGTSTGNPLLLNSNYYIGYNYRGSNYYNGYIDDFRVYNSLLNQSQINELASGRFSKFSYINNNTILCPNYITSKVGLGIQNPNEIFEVNGIVGSTSFIGSAYNISNINWGNLINIPDIILNGSISIITSNVLNIQNYINSNSIQDLLSFYISSNNLSEQQFINSNSIQDLLSFYITSNNLLEQQFINSNSINDNLSFYISSNILSEQQFINSNSIQDLLSFYISSNNLSEQQFINSNSIQDLLEFYITSNNLSEQKYINSNSINDLLSFYITLNNLSEQQFINSNSIQNLLSFYITSNNLNEQQYINSNSIQDLLGFYITSNNLLEQQLINSNSIQDLLGFYITSNNLSDQKYINSNSIQDLLGFYITSNNLSEQQYINSNSIQDLLSFYISSNNLNEQQYINSNSIQDLLSFYITSNNLSEQQFINSNSIQDIITLYISSNILIKQNYINSNNINDVISFYISSNILSDHQYINSNSINDLTSYYITSNNLYNQQYINSNSIQDLLLFNISSNILSKQQYINSNFISDLTSLYISSNILNDFKYINSNSISDLTSFYISSNNLYDQNYINSNTFSDLTSFYISSNILSEQQFINSNSISDLTSFYISSNSYNNIILPYMSSNLYNILNDISASLILTTASIASIDATLVSKGIS